MESSTTNEPILRALLHTVAGAITSDATPTSRRAGTQACRMILSALGEPAGALDADQLAELVLARLDGTQLFEAEQVMTADEVADFLGCDRKSVYEIVTRQEIPHRRIGRRVFLLRSAVLEWLASGPAERSARTGASSTWR